VVAGPARGLPKTRCNLNRKIPVETTVVPNRFFSVVGTVASREIFSDYENIYFHRFRAGTSEKLVSCGVKR
jgi:hypothetical protein